MNDVFVEVIKEINYVINPFRIVGEEIENVYFLDRSPVVEPATMFSIRLMFSMTWSINVRPMTSCKRNNSNETNAR